MRHIEYKGPCYIPEIPRNIAVHESGEGIRKRIRIVTLKGLGELEDFSLKKVKPFDGLYGTFEAWCGNLSPRPREITLERTPDEIYRLSERCYRDLRERHPDNNPKIRGLIQKIDLALSSQ